MDFHGSSGHLCVSQEHTPTITPSPPNISTTDPGGLENDFVVDEGETGVLRSRGRRRRPGRGRVRLQETPNDDSQTISSGKATEESSDLLQPPSLSFAECDSPSRSSSRLGNARGSFKMLVSKVTEKIQPTKKQGKKRQKFPSHLT